MSRKLHFPRPMTDGWPRVNFLSALTTYDPGRFHCCCREVCPSITIYQTKMRLFLDRYAVANKILLVMADTADSVKSAMNFSRTSNFDITANFDIIRLF
jgi:hypothetical protein